MIITVNNQQKNPVKVMLISLNRYTQPYPVYPLGMSSIAAALQECGCTVQMCDCNIDFDTIEQTVQQFQPDCVGISIRNIDDIRMEHNTFFIPELESLVKRVKSVTQVPVILGGSAFSLFPETLLSLSNAQFGITGEGERSFQLLMDCFREKDFSVNKLLSIPALVFHDGVSIRRNDPKILESSKIPRPHRPARLLDYYQEHSTVVNIQTQRGCPFTCCYCTYPVIEGRCVRKRSAEDVAEEIDELSKSGRDYFFIVDSVFNIDNNHAAAVCEAMIKRNIQCTWSCFLRPSGLTSDLMALMKRAGLSHIEFGTDSFSNQVLKSYGKNFTFDDILHSSELAREHKVHYAHFLIAGGPGETEATLREGFENSKQLKKTVIFPFEGMRVFPDTQLYQTALEEGVISVQDNCLNPVFYISPALTSEKIRQLHQEFNRLRPNWIIGEEPEDLKRVKEGLRKKGIRGPLWEFLAR